MSRVLIKLSGEALSGGKKNELYDVATLGHIAAAMRGLVTAGHELMIVLGGGNLFRGAKLSGALDVARSTADYIGMLATIQNALVLRDYFVANGIDTCVASSIAMPQVCEDFVPQRIERHLEKGRIVIFAAGLGTPYFTTDTTAVQRALELGAAQVVFVKNGVDGLYTADPKTVPSAKLVRHVSSEHVLRSGLRALDLSAVALARDNALPLRIIGMGDLAHALDPEKGSLITP